LYITAILQLGVAGITVLVVMLVLALQKGFAVLMQTKKGTYFRKASALSLTALIALLVFGLGDSLFYSVQLFLLLLLCVGFVRIVFSIYTVQLMAKEEDAGLDIDLDTERKVKSDNKLLINLCELAVKLVKKIIKLVKKIIKAVKNRKNVPKKKALKKNKKRSEKKVVIPTEASEVVITDENTYEEESTCQEK
jgi:Ca2+/Na+ antiporter